jgi:hypothetical protein
MKIKRFPAGVDYHSHVAISQSKAADFAKYGPVWFNAVHNKGTLVKPSTALMKFGQMAHGFILRGEFTQTVIPPREVLSKSGSRAGRAFKEFVSDHPEGTYFPSVSESRQLWGIKCAVAEHPTAKALIADGEHEIALLAPDSRFPERGLRAKLDVLADKRIVDVKFRQDIHDFDKLMRHVVDMHYDWQLAFYRAIAGDSDRACVLLFIQPEPPHQTRCVRLGDDWLSTAYSELNDVLDDLSARYKADNWDPPEGNDLIYVRSRPERIRRRFSEDF